MYRAQTICHWVVLTCKKIVSSKDPKFLSPEVSYIRLQDRLLRIAGGFRKWRKTAPWPRVTLVAYELELSIMGQKMFRGIVCITFAVWTEKFNIFHYFSQKIREIEVLRLCLQLWISTIYFLHHCYRHLTFIAVTSIAIKKRQKSM